LFYFAKSKYNKIIFTKILILILVKKDITDIFYKSDCLHFRGDLPCKPHKEFGYKCENCNLYIKTNKKILIIKLGAIGDVIRTTPLLEKINQVYPNSDIWWLTQYPDILPREINKILPLNLESILLIENTDFDIVYSLDKDLPAVSVAKKVNSKEKHGFILENGKPAPINQLAKHKFYTGLFDDVNKANQKSYLEEIFEICGWKFEYQDYQINLESSRKFDCERYRTIVRSCAEAGDIDGCVRIKSGGVGLSIMNATCR
jgi:heptosyltransferase-2